MKLNHALKTKMQARKDMNGAQRKHFKYVSTRSSNLQYSMSYKVTGMWTYFREGGNWTSRKTNLATK